MLTAIDGKKTIAGVSESDLRHAWHTVARISHREAGNFYYAFLFLPMEQRRGIYSLYAFCRNGDDIVDIDIIKSRNPEANLTALRAKLKKCFEGLYEDNVTLALADTIRRFDLPIARFDEMFEGLGWDLTVNQYATFADLRRYCYRVASTIGLLCLKIFNADTEQTRLYAEHLGIALQLTNILRDLREDYERNRVYVPVEDLARFNLTPANLLDHNRMDHLRELVRFEIRRARGLFETARTYLPTDLKPRLIVPRIMSAIYMEILDRLAGADRFDRRIALSRREKMMIAYKCLGV